MYKVVICTNQWVQPLNRGGIARPTFELARNLALNGCEVSVLGFRLPQHLSSYDKKLARENGFEIEEIDVSQVSETSPFFLHMQRTLQNKVNEKEPHIVIAQEWAAPLLLALNLKNSKIISWLHGGTLYDFEGNNRYFSNIYQAIDSELERYQVSLSDAVVCPSNFLIDFYKKREWTMPKNLRVFPYHFPNFNSHKRHFDTKKITFVFIGQLSYRKGFDIFLKLAEISKIHNPELDLQVLIYGASAEFSGEEASRHLKSINIESKFLGVASPEIMWQNIRSYNSIVFCTSRIDNSPNIIYEAVSNGVPAVIVGSNNGAIELSKYSGLIKNVPSLSEYNLGEILTLLNTANVEENVSHNPWITEQWLELFGSLVDKKNRLEPAALPSVSVVITSCNRPELLMRALASIKKQTFTPQEVLIVDDASLDFERIQKVVIESFPTAKIFRNYTSMGPGYCRNLGVKQSSSDLVAFLDDDNTFEINHLNTMVTEIANSGADVVVPYLKIVDSNGVSLNRTAVFIGGVLESISTIVNTIGDTHFVARKEIFELHGGFDEIWPNSQEDWALLLRWNSVKVKIVGSGEATVNYQANLNGVQHTYTGFSSWDRIDKNSGRGNWVSSFGARASLTSSFGISTQKNAVQAMLGLIKHRNWRQINRGLKIVLNDPKALFKKYYGV